VVCEIHEFSDGPRDWYRLEYSDTKPNLKAAILKLLPRCPVKVLTEKEFQSLTLRADSVFDVRADAFESLDSLNEILDAEECAIELSLQQTEQSIRKHHKLIHAQQTIIREHEHMVLELEQSMERLRIQRDRVQRRRNANSTRLSRFAKFV
jgi:hypothetical protein